MKNANVNEPNIMGTPDRSISSLEMMLKSAYELNPTVIAELGALEGLEAKFIEPLQIQLGQALNWLDSILTWLARPPEELELDALKTRALSDVAFAAQRDIQVTLRNTRVGGCAWDEALTRCQEAMVVLATTLEAVVMHIEALELSQADVSEEEVFKPTTEYPLDVINSLAREANLTPIHAATLKGVRYGRAKTIRQPKRGDRDKS